MKFIKLDEIDSTNNYLKENIEKFSMYDIVSAKTQTTGRGRRGNTWISSKGMGLFSFLLKPEKELSIEEYIKLPLIAGISVLSALKKIKENDYKFKWTNDIFLENKKLCGILVEKVEKNFIVGIGININNEITEELKEIAISLKTNKSINNFKIDEIILKIVQEFSVYYSRFIQGEWLEILTEINQHNFLLNKNIKVTIGNEIYNGIAGNIIKDGWLEVNINGEPRLFNAGEIKIEKGFV